MIRRRQTSVFSLAFLDCICCGFGAVILVFILTALGGLMLFAFRASKQRLPLAVVLLHAAFALCGLTLLFVGWSRA